MSEDKIYITLRSEDAAEFKRIKGKMREKSHVNAVMKAMKFYENHPPYMLSKEDFERRK